MVKIYIAGKYDNLSEIREAQRLVIEAGFEISYDWTKNAELTLKSDKIDSIVRMRSDADNDLNGVIDADWSIILLTDYNYVYRGSFCELGASITRDKFRNSLRTIVIRNTSAYAMSCCFAHHSDIIYCDNMEDAILYIKKIKS
jgi:hypothetical protein